MLTLIAATTLLLIHPAPQARPNVQRLRELGLAPVPRTFTIVKRDWVRPDQLRFRFRQNLAALLPYGDLDAQLVRNIDAAGIPIESQGARGTCTIFATQFLAEYELARQAKFKSSERLNPEYLNWAANAATGQTDDGSSFPAVVAGLGKYGCSDWNDPKVYKGDADAFNPDDKPSSAIVKKAEAIKGRVVLYQIFSDQSHIINDAHMKQILGLLDAGCPVAVGQEWPAGDAWRTLKLDGYTVLEGTGAVSGAHTMPIVGYKRNPKAPGGGYFLFRNSWGEGWGAKGYHFMTFDWVRNHTYDACVAVGGEFAAHS